MATTSVTTPGEGSRTLTPNRIMSHMTPGMGARSENLSYSVVQIDAQNTGGASTFVTLTVGAGGVPAGSLIIVAIEERTNGAGTGNVVDSAGNTYTSAGNVNLNNAAGNGHINLFYCWNCLALVNANTITYNKATGTDAAAATACYATGVDASADPLYGTVTNTAFGNNSNAPSVTSGSPDSKTYLWIGIVGTRGTSGTFAQATNFTTPPNESLPGSPANASPRIDGGHYFQSGQQTYAPTFSGGTASVWGALIVAFNLQTGSQNAYTAAVTEAANATDAEAPTLATTATVTEAATAASTQDAVAGDLGSVTEAASATDSVSAVAAFNAAHTEAVNATDTSDGVLGTKSIPVIIVMG